MRVDTALLLAAVLTTSPMTAMARKDVHQASSPPFAVSNSSSISTKQSTTSTRKHSTTTTTTTTSRIQSSESSTIDIPLSSSSLDTSSTTPSDISSASVASLTTSATSSTAGDTSSTSSDLTTSTISETSQISSQSAISHSTSHHGASHGRNSTTPAPSSLTTTTAPLSLSNTTAATLTTSTRNTTTHTRTRVPHKSTTTPLNLPPGYTTTKVPCNATSTARMNGGRCRNGSMISIIPTCTPLPPSKTFTEFLVVHTSTTTFLGNRTDYRPPHGILATPDYCNPNLFPLVPSPFPDASWSGFMGTMVVTTETFTVEGQPITGTFALPSLTAAPRVPVTTYVTVDPNPSAVFPNDPIPSYGHSSVTGLPTGDKTPVDGDYPGDPGPPTPTYTITAGPTSVIINSQTFTVTPGGRSTVTVGNGVFTIDPTAVVGEGASVTRPPPAPEPSSSVLDGIPVTSAGPNLQIGGGTFAIPSSSANTVQVNGKAVTINPDGVTIGGDSMGFLRPAPSDVLVTGGEMLTAIGGSVVVLHSVTYTYGTGIPPVVQVINGDTVAIEPTGILIHGSMIGGATAKPTDTEYEIVGGATIEKIPPSMIIVNGVTYAVGPGANKRTVVIGDETMTIGPIGLAMASTTMRYPFDTSVTATVAGRSAGAPMPQETGKDEEDAAYSLRPDVRVGLTCLCIVLGVLLLG